MDYDKNSFLAGLSVGRTLKGWSGGAGWNSGWVLNFVKLWSESVPITVSAGVLDFGFFSGQYFFIVQPTDTSQNPIVYSSQNGETWTSAQVDLPSGSRFNGPGVRGNGIYAIRCGDQIAYTRDFSAWALAASPVSTSDSHFGIGYSSGLFWLHDSNSVSTTKDFLSFERETISGISNYMAYAINSDPGFIASDNSVPPSISLIPRTWGSVQKTTSYNSFGIYGTASFLGCAVVLLSSEDQIVLQYSQDGKTWDTIFASVSCDSASCELVGDGNLWVFATTYGDPSHTTCVVTSDLTSTKTVLLPGKTNRVVFFRGIYFAFSSASGGVVYMSTDLSSWDLVNQLNDVYDMKISGGLIFASGHQIVGTASYYSVDGTTWELFNGGFSNVCEKDGVFLVEDILTDVSSPAAFKPLLNSAYVAVRS